MHAFVIWIGWTHQELPLSYDQVIQINIIIIIKASEIAPGQIAPLFGDSLAVFTQLCTAREITSRESVNARVRVHTINIRSKKLEFLSADDISSGMSTGGIAWPQDG